MGIPKWAVDILQNEDAIKINQDRLGKQGYCVSGCAPNKNQQEAWDNGQVWMRELHNGDLAVAIMNLGVSGAAVPYSTTCEELNKFGSATAVKCTSSKPTYYLDVFSGKTGKFSGTLSATLRTSSVKFVRVYKEKPG